MRIFLSHYFRNNISIRLVIISMICLIVACGRSNNSDTTIPDVEVDESYFNSANEIDIKESKSDKQKRVFGSSRDMLVYMRESKDSARYRTGILMQMAKDAPRYADSILNSNISRFLVVDKAKMRVIVFDKFGNEIKSYRMACAKKYGNKHEKGDSRTPEGFFHVEGVYDSTEWLFTDDNGITSDVKGQYGPRFIRIKTSPRRWPIGIHGTNAPWSIGGRRSHGCIRLSNDDIMELVELVEKGMPIIISPSKKDMQVNYEEESPTLRIWTGGKNLTEFKPEKPQETVAIDTIPSADSVKINKNIDLDHSSEPDAKGTEDKSVAPETNSQVPPITYNSMDSIP